MAISIQEARKLEKEGKLDRERPREERKSKIISFLEKNKKYMKPDEIRKGLNITKAIHSELAYLSRMGHIDRIYVDGKKKGTKNPLYGPVG